MSETYDHKDDLIGDKNLSDWDEEDTRVAIEFSEWYEQQGPEKHDPPLDVEDALKGVIDSVLKR